MDALGRFYAHHMVCQTGSLFLGGQKLNCKILGDEAPFACVRDSVKLCGCSHCVLSPGFGFRSFSAPLSLYNLHLQSFVSQFLPLGKLYENQLEKEETLNSQHT